MESQSEGDVVESGICEVIQILGSKWAFAVIAELSKGDKKIQSATKKY